MSTTSERSRYDRQSRLTDVGEDGQAKLCAAQVTPRSNGFTRTIEERYLRAAGLQLRDGAPDARTLPELGLRHGPAREVADGALHALVSIRAVLGVGS